MSILSVSELAETLNLTPRRIQQLAAEGMPKMDTGAYDRDICLLWYLGYLQKLATGRPTSDQASTAELLRIEQTRLAAEQADKLAIQNAELRSDLCRLSVWESELAGLLSEIRSAFLRMPSKLAPILDGPVNDRKRVIAAEIRQILGGLADYKPGRRKTRRAVSN